MRVRGPFTLTFATVSAVLGSFRRLHRSEDPPVDGPAPGEDEPYLRWLRQQPCCHCQPVRGPSEAHHSTVAPCTRHWRPGIKQYANGAVRQFRGKGKKSDDRYSFPLCLKCHRLFHDAAGPFRDWDKAKRRAWQEQMSAEYRARYDDATTF